MEVLDAFLEETRAVFENTMLAQEVLLSDFVFTWRLSDHPYIKFREPFSPIDLAVYPNRINHRIHNGRNVQFVGHSHHIRLKPFPSMPLM